MKLKQKKVSIIIPVYNSEENIRRCIDSCIKQTYKNLEIVCINDGSTDNSLKIIKEYKKKDSRINIINQKNMGVSVARNNGIKSCDGEYITFLDSDDYLNIDSIEIMVNLLNEKNVDLIRTNYTRVFENNCTKQNKKLIIKNRKFDKEEITKVVLNKILSGEISSHLWLLCIKKNVIIDNHIEFIPGIKVMQDKLFYLKLFTKANSFYQSDSITYNYYCNNNSTIMSTNKCLIRIEFIVKVAELCEKILENEHLIENVNLNELYKSHFVSLCREIYFCNSSYNAIEKIKSMKKNNEYIKIIKNINYKNLRLDNKVILFLLKHNKFNLLYIFSSFIIKIKR